MLFRLSVSFLMVVIFIIKLKQNYNKTLMFKSNFKMYVLRNEKDFKILFKRSKYYKYHNFICIIMWERKI